NFAPADKTEGLAALASRGREGARIVPAPCLSAPLRRRAAGRFVALGDHAAARDQRSRPADFDDHAAEPDVDAHVQTSPSGRTAGASARLIRSLRSGQPTMPCTLCANAIGENGFVMTCMPSSSRPLPAMKTSE